MQVHGSVLGLVIGGITGLIFVTFFTFTNTYKKLIQWVYACCWRPPECRGVSSIQTSFLRSVYFVIFLYRASVKGVPTPKLLASRAALTLSSLRSCASLLWIPGKSLHPETAAIIFCYKSFADLTLSPSTTSSSQAVACCHRLARWLWCYKHTWRVYCGCSVSMKWMNQQASE